jgi:hypothetical protein
MLAIAPNNFMGSSSGDDSTFDKDFDKDFLEVEETPLPPRVKPEPEQNTDTLRAEADFPAYEIDAQSAFEILHDIEQRERQQILEEIRQLPLSISGRVSARLQALIENAEEEYPEEELLSVRSMWDVTKFLRSGHAWTYPDIVVSARGNIVLDWLHDVRHHLTIEFLGEGQTKLVLLAPDIVWKQRSSVFAGTQSVESIPALLKIYDALSWTTQ